MTIVLSILAFMALVLPPKVEVTGGGKWLIPVAFGLWVVLVLGLATLALYCHLHG